MPSRAGRAIRTAALAALAAGLAACQPQGQSPVVTATVSPAQDGMAGDIRRILTQGGLNPNAPGSLQTAKMPADVQQAVAALQGGPQQTLPLGSAEPVTPVGVRSIPQSGGGSSIAALPTATAPSNALALAPAETPAATPFAPVNAAAQAPLLAALAQSQAAHGRSLRAAPARLAHAPAHRSAPALALAPVAVPAVAPTLPVAAPMLAQAAVLPAPVPVAVAPAPPPKSPEPPPRRF